MASAADVPHKFDCVFSDGTNSQGYTIFDSADRGSPKIKEKAIHSFSPTFVPRTNVEGNYGDNSQDFFLTFSQNDWSLGEGKKYQGDEPRRRFWRGTSIDVTRPGEVRLRKAVESLTTADEVIAAGSVNKANAQTIAFATASNLYTIDDQGDITDENAHGLGTSPAAFGIAGDGGGDIYITAPSVGIRKYDGSSYTTFSATGAESLAYLNNALYSYSAGVLRRYSTAGVATTLHTFQGIDGGTITLSGMVIPFGGKLLILLRGLKQLWVYDGVGVSKLHDFETDFDPYMFCVLNGIVYIAGRLIRGDTGTSADSRPTIYYYANGQVGLLWEAEDYVADAGARTLVVPFEGSLLFTDSTRQALCSYNQNAGGFHSVGTYTAFTGALPVIASSSYYVFLGSESTTANLYPQRTPFVASGTVISSLIDFDSSLDKFFRGIKVDYDEASTGDGGSIDIAYRLNDVNSTYTTLQTGAVSGTEYTLGSVGSSVEGRSISVRVTLNKGTSTLGPVLKRVYVRAAPIVNVFHRSRHWLDCQGEGGRYGETIELRDDSHSPKSGLELAHTLKEFSEAGLITFTDKFGSRTSVIEELEFMEIRPSEFIASVLVREV